MPAKEPKRTYDRIPRDIRAAMVKEIQSWFLDERDEEIGDLAAGFLLEFVAGLVGPEIYNMALADAGKLFDTYSDLLKADLAANTQEPAVRPAQPDDA